MVTCQVNYKLVFSFSLHLEKMNELDIERVKQYEMPKGDLEKVTAEYKETAFDKIKQFTKVQFLHWTEEEFSSCFRKMLT